MSKFKFRGKVIGDNHQFGDKNTQINRFVEESTALDFDDKEIRLLLKMAENSDSSKRLENILIAIGNLKAIFGNDQTASVISPVQLPEKKLSSDIKELIKEDKLEEAMLLLEDYFTKTDSKDHLDQIAVFQANIKSLSEQFTAGTHGYEEMTVFRNRAYFRLLSMIPDKL